MDSKNQNDLESECKRLSNMVRQAKTEKQPKENIKELVIQLLAVKNGIIENERANRINEITNSQN